MGKTTLAAELAARLRPMDVLHVDDLLADPETVGRSHTSGVREMKVGPSDGDGIDPRVTWCWDPDVRVVYLIETGREILHRTFVNRSSASRLILATRT